MPRLDPMHRCPGCRRRAIAVVACFVLALFAALIAGCGVPLDSPAPGKDEVLAHVEEVCPNESYELVSVEEVNELPQKVIYRFTSTERQLSFTATSEIVDPDPDPKFPTAPYPLVTCDYAEQVYDLYSDEALAAYRTELARLRPDTTSYTESNGMTLFRSYTDLEAIVEAAKHADAVYERELVYNPADWIREHASIGVHVGWVSDDASLATHDSWENVGATFGLSGAFSPAPQLDKLAGSYAQLIVDGAIPTDATLPARYFDGLHRRVLSHITIDGIEVPFGFDEVDEGLSYRECNLYQREYISSGSPCAARWNDGTGSYEVYLDLGRLEEAAWEGLEEDGRIFMPDSWLIQHISELATGTYLADATSCSWTIGNARGSIRGDGPNDNPRFMLEADGDTYELDNDSGAHTGTVFTYIDVALFAELMDCTYRIDEASGTIELTTQR